MAAEDEPQREPWRDFGCFNMTRREAEKQARYAARLHEGAGLGAVSEREYFSHWRPWSECDAAEFAAAGVSI